MGGNPYKTNRDTRQEAHSFPDNISAALPHWADKRPASSDPSIPLDNIRGCTEKQRSYRLSDTLPLKKRCSLQPPSRQQGLIHPTVAANYAIKERVYVAVLDMPYIVE